MESRKAQHHENMEHNLRVRSTANDHTIQYCLNWNLPISQNHLDHLFSVSSVLPLRKHKEFLCLCLNAKLVTPRLFGESLSL